MGSKVSPEAADITRESTERNPEKNVKTDKIIWQGRYRDDGFQHWDADEGNNAQLLSSE